ncbi:MAG: kelch repeat-containing protein [Flavobacteriales bacterium]
MKKLLLTFAFAIAAGVTLFSQIEVMPCQLYPFSLNQPRYAHTMHVLDLDILVLGGYDDGGVLATAQYNETTINMNEGHADHTSEELNDGRVIVIGGWNGSTNLTVIEVFDQESQQFDYIADMETGRSFHRSIKLNDGRILITGGYDGNINLTSCEIFDPSTEEMIQASDMNFARSSHTITKLPDGKILVTGGYNPDNGFQQTSCEIYDPELDTWTNAAPLNSGRDNHAAAIYGNDLIVSGGRMYNGDLNIFEGQSTIEKYDIENDIWTLITIPMAAPYSYHQLYATSGWGPAFITPGGVDHSGIGVDLTYSEMEEYYSWGNWSEGNVLLGSNDFFISEVPAAPGYLYASVLQNYELYYSGGLDENGISSDIYQCFLTWESVPEIQPVSLDIYPLPATDRTNIRLDRFANYTLEIYDATGKLVESRKGSGNTIEVNHPRHIPGQGDYFRLHCYGHNHF